MHFFVKPIYCRKNTKIWVPVALDNKKKFLARTSSQRSLSSNNNSGRGSTGIDADFNNWLVEYDLISSFLRCSIYFQDVNKIPRNHLRSVYMYINIRNVIFKVSWSDQFWKRTIKLKWQVLRKDITYVWANNSYSLSSLGQF